MPPLVAELIEDPEPDALKGVGEPPTSSRRRPSISAARRDRAPLKRVPAS
jgi:hypothetical protein